MVLPLLVYEAVALSSSPPVQPTVPLPGIWINLIGSRGVVFGDVHLFLQTVQFWLLSYLRLILFFVGH